MPRNSTASPFAEVHAKPDVAADIAVHFAQVVKDFTGDWTGRKVRALDGVTLEVPRGAIVAVVGPNGSGKSTLLKLAARLTQPTRGSCDVTGRVGYLPEAVTLPGLMTPGELLEIFGAAAPTEHVIDRVLASVGLREYRHRRLHEFSKGMKQRVALAATLMGEPDILLLDEPTDGLDPRAVLQLAEILRAERAAGRTVFLTSHFLPAVELLADRVAVIEKGKLVYAGPRDDVVRRGGVERIYLETTVR